MHERYVNPLCTRYASEDMQYIFSDDNKFSTWRKLWIALAESQQELGLEITDEQIAQMKEHIHDIDYDLAAQKEKELRHDVMAHVHVYSQQCPLAGPIIHLGATSCYVCDNTDIIQQHAALLAVKKLLVNAIAALSEFAEQHKALPSLAYTHFQPAQPTTIGKRATLWMQDLMMDLEQLDWVLGNLKLLGCKGTTGTSASFLALFDGDHEKVKDMEMRIARKMGFEQVCAVSGQTYTRKVDYFTLSMLSGIAQSAYKFSNDIRLMSHLKEVDEPFEKKQIGSSAMAYKRNPMRSERIASLSRYVMVDALNPALTASAQWFERTLDDSANKRISIPEAFLAVDAILSLYINIVKGMVVYPAMINKHLQADLPFMATENILMYCVKKGGDRQALHERIRIHSVDAAKEIKLGGADNDLIERILADEAFNITREEIADLISTEKFIGRAKEQTEEFVAQAKEVLAANREFLGMDVDIKV